MHKPEFKKFLQSTSVHKRKKAFSISSSRMAESQATSEEVPSGLYCQA